MKVKKNDDVIIIKKDDDDFGAVLNFAVRHCLGRLTYAPHMTIDKIRPWLSMLSDKTLWCFERDIESAQEYGNLGDPNVDVPNWLRFLADVRAEIERRKQNESQCSEG